MPFIIIFIIIAIRLIWLYQKLFVQKRRLKSFLVIFRVVLLHDIS